MEFFFSKGKETGHKAKFVENFMQWRNEILWIIMIYVIKALDNVGVVAVYALPLGIE